MRLKTFTAPSLADAMRQVRASLGEDAVIVSIEEPRGRLPAQVVAAVEARPEPQPVREALHPQLMAAPDFDAGQLATLLRYHGLPASVRDQLQELAGGRDGDLLECLAQALGGMLHFQPLTPNRSRPLMLVGQPGQGKSVNIARLAHGMADADSEVRVITTDAAAAGALAQLEGFCAPLGIPVLAARDAVELGALLGLGFDGVTLIDTAGINPYAIDDVSELAGQIKVSGAEPVWVLGAGGDPLEAAENATLFRSLGVRRFILSRADAARRFAAPVVAATQAALALAGIADSPFVSAPLLAPTPWDLAHRLLTKPDAAALARLGQIRTPTPRRKAAS